PDFLNGPRHALAVARALHAEFPALTFDFTAKIEHLLRERAHLAELAALGALFVVSAAESLDDEVLAILDKGHTRADIETALAVTRAAGLSLRPTWVAFTPWTTLAGYRAWLDFIAAKGLVDATDPVQYALGLVVPAGSGVGGGHAAAAVAPAETRARRAPRAPRPRRLPLRGGACRSARGRAPGGRRRRRGRRR